MKVSCYFYALAVPIKEEAIFCRPRVIPKKQCFRDLIYFRGQKKGGDAHTKLNHIQNSFQSLVQQVTAVPTHRTQEVTLYMQKHCYLWNMNQWTNSRNKIILDIFLLQCHQLKMLLTFHADHNHSLNYCIYTTVCNGTVQNDLR